MEQRPERKLVIHLVLLPNQLGKLVDHLVEVARAADIHAACILLLGGCQCGDDEAVNACK